MGQKPRWWSRCWVSPDASQAPIRDSISTCHRRWRSASSGREPTRFEPHRERLVRHGIRGGSDLALWLLEAHGLAVLERAAFGDDPNALRFRAATSLLYGDTAGSRSQALGSADPLRVPHVAHSLDRLDAIVASVTSA